MLGVGFRKWDVGSGAWEAGCGKQEIGNAVKIKILPPPTPHTLPPVSYTHNGSLEVAWTSGAILK